MEQSHKYKTGKYEDLKKELEKEGYNVIVKAVEMGAKRFHSRHPVPVSGSKGVIESNVSDTSLK